MNELQLSVAAFGILARPHESDVFGERFRARLVTGPADRPAMLGGAIRLTHALHGRWRPSPAGAFSDVPLVLDETLLYAERILECSTALQTIVKHTISLLHPAADLRLSTTSIDQQVLHGAGSCHSIREVPGALWCTTDCPLSVAQALVHEAAHTRLRLLGLQVVGSGHLVLNPVEQLYRSPILKRGRPMSAVVHALYSFAHVAELDLAYLRSPYRLGKRVVADALRLNVQRLASGYWTVKMHAKLDERGAALCGGLLDWVEDLVARSTLWLEKMRLERD